MELLRLEKIKSNHELHTKPQNHSAFVQTPLKNNFFVRPWREGQRCVWRVNLQCPFTRNSHFLAFFLFGSLFAYQLLVPLNSVPPGHLGWSPGGGNQTRALRGAQAEKKPRVNTKNTTKAAQSSFPPLLWTSRDASPKLGGIHPKTCRGGTPKPAGVPAARWVLRSLEAAQALHLQSAASNQDKICTSSS